MHIVPKTDTVTPKVPRPLSAKELLKLKRPLTTEELRIVNDHNRKLARKRKNADEKSVGRSDLNALAHKFNKPETSDHPSNPDFKPVENNGWDKDNLGESTDWDKQQAIHDQQRFSGKRKNQSGKKGS